MLEHFENHVRALHDALDDYNAENATPERLCVMCDGTEYDAIVGIVHSSDCLILTLRDAMPTRTDW